MRHLFQTEPAYSSTAGVTVTGEAVVISTVFRGQQSCGIILYYRHREMVLQALQRTDQLCRSLLQEHCGDQL